MVVVSYYGGCLRLVLVNRLKGLSLPRNSANINWPAQCDLVVDWAIKLQRKQLLYETMKYASDTKKSNKEQLYQQNDSMKLWSECVSCIFSDVHISEKSAFEYGLVNHALSSAMRTLVKVSTIMFLSFRTDKSEQTV